jgi:internalin A
MTGSEATEIARAMHAAAAPGGARPWAHFEKLTELVLDDIFLVDADIESIGRLAELRVLAFRGRVTTLEPLRVLNNLTKLNCNNTMVSDLEPLRSLTQLSALDCSHTSVSDLEPLRDLRSLAHLNCSRTPVADLGPLRELTNHTGLDRIRAQVSNLESPRKLAYLDCSQTHVTDLGPLQAITNLTDLICSQTHVADLEPLRALNNLTKLDCHHTQVSDLEPLRALKNLRELDCSRTMVSDLEPLRGLTQLANLRCNNLYCLRGFPQELVRGECSASVRGYFQDLETGIAPEQSVRVLLVGNGFTGKSTLARCLVHGAAPPTPVPERTHAIVALELKLGNVEARIWDFAGQEIYHATHRLFLRANGVFLLLWTEPDPEDPTPDTERHGPGYWLDLIGWFGNGPVIVVKNKIDVLDAAPDPNELTKLPHLVMHQLKIAAGINHKVGVLRAVLQEELRTLVEQRGLRIGASWARARGALAALGDKYLSRQAFDDLAHRQGVRAPDTFLTYLVNTGHVFYAEDAFGGRVFLDESWIVDATYRLFDPSWPRPTLEQLQNGGTGTITGRQFHSIVWPHASDQEVQLYLTFVTSSEIAFELQLDERPADLSRRTFVVPALLPEVTTTKLKHLRGLCAWSIHLEFKFPLLHRALVERLLVRSAWKNGERQWWRNTALWLDDESGCNVLFEAVPAQHVVILRVAATQHANLAEAVARLILLIQEAEPQLQHTLRLSDDGEHFATIRALELAHRAHSDVTVGDRAVSRQVFTKVYTALVQPISELTESGYGAAVPMLRRPALKKARRKTTLHQQINIYGAVTMGDNHKTTTTTITGSTGVAVTHGDHSNATAHAAVRGDRVPTQQEHEQQVDETQIALIQSRRELDAATWEVLNQFLRIARQIQVDQQDLKTTQAKMKDALDDAWAQQQASKLRSPTLPEGLAIAKAIAGNPVMQEVAKKLLGL